ncbi:MAG: sulfotransferase family 2 domain-containing protein [Mangrovicoccus sp.]
MILSRRRGFLFIHIPKTGGTALALALENHACADDILVGDTPKARRRRKRQQDLPTSGRLWKHSNLADLHGLVLPGDLAELFIFTLVRNPWDRAVSYYHWIKGQNFDHIAVSLARVLSFEEFIQHPHSQASFRAASYASYITDHSGREQCDLFIRLEHLAEDIRPLEAHLGFRLADPGQVNASDRDPDYRKYYGPKTQALIGDICAEDIARFGYDF